MDSIGDRPDRPFLVRDAGPERSPHLAGDLPVALADRVHGAGTAQGQGRHVEIWLAIVISQRQESIAPFACRLPEARKLAIHQMEGEDVMPGGNGGVGGEDGCVANLPQGIQEALAPLDMLADSFEHRESRVPFVEVPNGGIVAKRAHCPDSAHPENDLLLQTHLPLADVQARREFSVAGGIFGHVRVEQQQFDASQPHCPDGHPHRPVSHRNFDQAGPPVRRYRAFYRHLVVAEPLVPLDLPPVGGDFLEIQTHRIDRDIHNTESDTTYRYEHVR